MLNKDYFNYLFKSKKHLFLLTCILQAVISFSYMGKIDIYNILKWPLSINYFIGLINAFVLPLIIFSYVHNKKAVDTFFALDMSRNTLLFTGLIYCLVACLVPYLISLFITFINLLLSATYASYINLFYILLTAFISYLLIIVFNTFIYLVANTVTDGIVILFAYYFIPLMIFIVGINFESNYLIGIGFVEEYLSKLLPLISPIALAVVEFLSLTIENYTYEFLTLAYIASILYCLVFIILLFYYFKNRKAERAGNYSNTFFAYPFIIGFYTIACLFFIATSRIICDFYGSIVLYALLFAAYFVGNFIYKRKLNLSKLQVILFISGIVISLVFNYICEQTKGFGLSMLYKFDYDKMVYEYNFDYNYENDDEFYDFITNIDGIDIDNIDSQSLYFTISSYSKNHNTVDIFEKYRLYSIEHYLDHENLGTKYNSYYYLYITYNDGKKNYGSGYPTEMISLAYFKTIAKDKKVAITMFDYQGFVYHLIYENNQYLFVDDEFYTIYDKYGYDTACKTLITSMHND